MVECLIFQIPFTFRSIDNICANEAEKDDPLCFD